MEIKMKPIGYIKSPFKTKDEIPRQSIYAKDTKAVIEILEEYREGIADIAEGNYGVILFYFHKSEGYKTRLIPRNGNVEVGVFSTRSPNRPNGIGMSVVKFIKNDGKQLEFEGVDMLDGTPVLDIKPYVKDLEPSL